jgi:hypothetical protein
MAANLAASVKVMDPGRRICVVCDEGVTIAPDLRVFFDDAVELPPDPLYPHVMNKLRLFDVSPYDETMFVDADCLLVKTDVDRYWQAARTRPFSITGGKRESGEWKGVCIEEVLQQEGSKYLIQMNAGVFYFDKSAAAKEFFRGLNEFYLRRSEVLNISIYRGKKTQTDELYLGVFMGMMNMDCENVENLGENSWMVSTWRSVHCSFDPLRGRSVIYKANDFLFGLPFLPTRITRLSPTFAHFIGLKPRRVYSRLARTFRSMASAQGSADVRRWQGNRLESIQEEILPSESDVVRCPASGE